MRRNTGRARRGGVAVAVVAAVGLLAACSVRVGETEGPGGGGETGGGSGVKGPDTFTSGVAEAAEQCAEVRVALGEAKPGEGGPTQMRLPLTMTNAGGTACLLRGFPGARLKGQDSQTWDLTRSGAEVEDVRLTPGASTTAYLTYLPETGDQRWDVTTVTVTPPNTDDSQVFDWPAGSVLRQDAATHPGTYVGPVGAWAPGAA